MLGLTALFVSPHRIPKLAAILSPVTLFKFKKGSVDRSYRLLFSSSAHRRKSGSKGSSLNFMGNYLYYNVLSQGSRCKPCMTAQGDPQPIPAKLPQGFGRA